MRRERKIDVWKHFIIEKRENKNAATCRKCMKHYKNANITRLGEHLKKGKKCTTMFFLK